MGQNFKKKKEKKEENADTQNENNILLSRQLAVSSDISGFHAFIVFQKQRKVVSKPAARDWNKQEVKPYGRDSADVNSGILLVDMDKGAELLVIWQDKQTL